MPKISIIDKNGTTISIEVNDRTSYAVGLAIKERAKLYIDPQTSKPYTDEVEAHKQLSLLEQAFKSVIRHERSG